MNIVVYSASDYLLAGGVIIYINVCGDMCVNNLVLLRNPPLAAVLRDDLGSLKHENT